MAEYISRTDAECIMTMLVMEVSARPKDFTCGEAFRAIRSIPSADVRPVVLGKWEEEDSASNRWAFKCSVCGSGPVGCKFNFCPNCGAKMDKEKTNG